MSTRNERRAQRIEKTLAFYCNEARGDGPDDPDDDLRDLLADTMHFCQQAKHTTDDFDEVLRRARQAFHEEVTDCFDNIDSEED